MPQLSLGDVKYANRRRNTKRELILEQMDKIIPWSDWVNLIAAYYPSVSFRQTRTPALLVLRQCCACTLCRTGSACLMKKA